MCHKQSVKRVTGPIEPQGVAHEIPQRNIVNVESSIVHHRAGELGITHGKAPNFSQKLDFEKRNRRDTPRAIPIQPGEISQPFLFEDKPDQKMRVEKKRHDRRRETRRLPGPRHSHDH